MKTVIALETSEEICSVALLINGSTIGYQKLSPRKHSELVLSMIDQLLAEGGTTKSAIDAVAYGCGPGSFTGVRISTAVAKGIGFSLQKPLLPVSTLTALAHGIYRKYSKKEVIVALDARMQEIYWSYCKVNKDNTYMQPINKERMSNIKQAAMYIKDITGKWCGAGSGWDSYKVQLKEEIDYNQNQIYNNIYCKAEDIAILGLIILNKGAEIDAEKAEPFYLRNYITPIKSF